jgi:hypothetical protein
VEREHDFGAVLAKDQTLNHVFMLRNESDKAVRILGAEARTPCCSRVVRPANTVIEPGGELGLPVEFRVGRASGRKKAEFLVSTDDRAQPVWTLALKAELYPEFSAETSGEIGLALGREGAITFPVICHRQGQTGLEAPIEARMAGPHRARLLPKGPADTESLPDGLERAARIVEVNLAPSGEIGRHAEEVVLVWADGEERRVPLRWEVEAVVRVEPSGLTIPAGAGLVARTVLLSADRPVRILEVSGPLVEADDSTRSAAAVHRLELRLRPGAPWAGATDVVIRTDHPDQPEVRLSVLVLPGAE